MAIVRVVRVKNFQFKSIFGISILKLFVLGFVNGFGYIMPTVYILQTGRMQIFDYMIKSIHLDLIFTIILAQALLQRE